MVKPLNIEEWNNDLVIRMDDGSRYRAIPSSGGLWIVSQIPPPPDVVPPKPAVGRFIWPFPLSEVTSEYGRRNGRLHAGMDFGRGASNRVNTPVIASAAGRVVIANKSGSHGGYGNAVVINHGGGLHTLYAHLNWGSIPVNVGQNVTQGQKIGGIGKTGRSYGYHLHFETHEGGYNWNASSRNPRDFFKKWNK